MAPEYGATCGIFPVDDETLDYLRFTGRTRRARRAGRGLLQGAGPVPHRRQPRGGLHATRSSSTSPPSSPASPGRSGRRTGSTLSRASKPSFLVSSTPSGRRRRAADARPADRRRRQRSRARAAPPPRCSPSGGESSSSSSDGAVVIAAITCCTNTSNPSVMLAAGLLAKKAVDAGPDVQALGQDLPRARARKVVTDYLDAAGLTEPPRGARLPPRRLRLHHLHRQLRAAAARRSATAIDEGDLVALLGALRQPQLRGPRPPRRARQLPRLAAAGGGLRPGRHGSTST